jgi:hypothetical protein
LAERSSAWSRTRVSNQLGIEYPIIQGPLGGFSSQRLTAAVSNFGGLGSFGAHGLAPSAIQEVVAEIRSLTNKPFAMNLWVSMEDEGVATSDAEAFERALSHLVPHLAAVGASKPQFSPYEPLRFEDQVRVLLDAKVPAFSFIYGIPRKEILEECHRQGILTIGTATTGDEAIALEQAGVDVVVASGFEAGGHRGSFLRSSADRGCRRDTGGSGRRNRGCPWHHCSLRARRRRCADGDGLSCLRRVWSKLVAPRGDPERKGEPNFAYTWVHRTPGTRHPQSTSGGDEPVRRRRSPVPAATGPHAEPRRASAAGRTERIPSLMGRPKCWTCPISRSNHASAIARQWSIRETWLMLGWSTPIGLWIVSFC